MIWWILLFFSSVLLLWLTGKLLNLAHRFRWTTVSIRLGEKLDNSNQSDPVNIYICICDHFQPFWGNVYQEVAEHRVATWCREFPRAARNHSDFLGMHPKHTFFYSEDDYNPQLLDNLAKMHRDGFSEVELLLAHSNDNAVNFRHRIEEFRDVLFLHHGLLRKNLRDNIIYGFIHGHWALNNSRPDGRNCGINNEIPILKETGCYADFTFPSAPDITQPPIINSVYFSGDIPGKARAHEHGYCAAPGQWSENDLLLIQGPLSLNWRNRFLGIFPSLENGGISYKHPYHCSRADNWIKTGIHVSGINNHLFIKLFTHGAIDQTMHYFFTENGLHQLWDDLETRYNDGDRFRLFYVSAYEMYKIVKNLCIGSSIYRGGKRI